MVEPIRPNEVDLSKRIPDLMIEAVNKLISQKYNGSSFTILQKDIVAKYVELGGDSKEMTDKGYLDFESLFEKYGWHVSYNKADMYEFNYDSFFKFTPKEPHERE